MNVQDRTYVRNIVVCQTRRLYLCNLIISTQLTTKAVKNQKIKYKIVECGSYLD